MKVSHKSVFTITAFVLVGGLFVYAVYLYNDLDSQFRLNARDKADLHYFYGCRRGNQMILAFTVSNHTSRGVIKRRIQMLRQLGPIPQGADCTHVFSDK